MTSINTGTTGTVSTVVSFLPSVHGYVGEDYTVKWRMFYASEKSVSPRFLQSISLHLKRRVLPAVRQTQGSKYTDRAKAYNES